MTVCPGKELTQLKGGGTMSKIDCSMVPESVQTDLCVMAIMRTAEALSTPEGRAAVEKGKEEYLRHLAEKDSAAVRK